MSEENPERGAPLSPKERAERVRLARERAAAAKAAREAGGGQASQPVGAAPSAATAAPDEAAPPAGGGQTSQPVEAAPSAGTASSDATAPPAGGAPAAERPRAAPATPEERAAAIEAARQRAASARAARESGGAPAPAAPATARAELSPEERAARLAEAQERAAAIRAERAATAPAAAATAATAVQEAPAWRIGPGGVTTQILAARPEPRAQEAATITPVQRMVVKRRELLRGGFWTGLAVLVAGGLAQTLDLMNPRDIHGFGSVITVPGSLVPKPGGDPYHFIEGKLWLVNLKPGEGVPQQFQSVAPPSDKGGLLAIYHKCVHLGCTVPWRSDFEFGGVTGWFRCPCHGSTYTKGGVRVFGPAPRSLDTFAITKVDASGLSVNTGKITLGNTSDPQRTVDAGPYQG